MSIWDTWGCIVMFARAPDEFIIKSIEINASQLQYTFYTDRCLGKCAQICQVWSCHFLNYLDIWPAYELLVFFRETEDKIRQEETK